MKTDWNNYTIAYDGINYNVNYRDNGDLVACENYVANSPSPNYPQPIVSNLSAGTYKTQDHKGDWYEFTLDEDLHGIDDVRDSVEFDKYSHVGHERNNNNEKVLDGTESWSKYTTNAVQNVYFSNIFTDCVTKFQSSICSHFINVDSSWSQSTGRYGFYSDHATVPERKFFNMGNECPTVEDFMALLASEHTNGTPVTVIYQLATPTHTPLTFTLNNDSTATELPMEFLTNIPSVDYPAEVFDASGEVISKTPNLTHIDNMNVSFENTHFINQFPTTPKVLLQPNTQYTLSFDYKINSATADVRCGIGYGDTTYKKDLAAVIPYPTQTSERFVYTLITPSTFNISAGTPYLQLRLTRTIVPASVDVDISNITFALGYYSGKARYTEPVTAQIPTLRKVNDVADEYKPKTGVKTKKISDWVGLDGKYAHSLQNFSGFKRLNVSPIFDAPFDSNQNFLCYKYNSINIPYGNPRFTIDVAQGADTDPGLRVSVSNADSGWSDTYSPTSNEAKAYFYGWQMCHEDGTSPYYKNEVPYNPETWAEWTKPDATITNGYLTYDNNSVGASIEYPVVLKPDTKYLILINVRVNTRSRFTSIFTGHNTDGRPFTLNANIDVFLGITGDVTGVQKKIAITRSEITVDKIYQFISPDTGRIEYGDIRLYELPAGSQIEADAYTLTAEELDEKYPFDGLNIKYWKKLVGTEQEIVDSITDVMPTASYEGFTPYKMIYELAEPIEEQLEPITLPTYPKTTITETTNDTIAELETTATVKVINRNT